ncbi:hypothetical protein BEH94_09175 [Candidatus Altiarchaeales archaeon WOR_SM1_SCG]|nr:hypothetical protein BEH94_09175 [Candidatus Altiarchaeales archaeon WOR_SM1_SCG]
MRCALTIKGKVQNAGYRGFIEERARERRLKGYVFNDTDGTVKLVCAGAKERIDDFTDVITLHEEDIFVENIFKNEIEDVSPIPKTFNRIQTDTMEDFGRKLDKGVDAIKAVGHAVESVKEDTVVLHEHTGLLKDMKEILERNQKDQKIVIGLLEKIAGK